MSEIRYVCLSDVHFGASTSVLTAATADGRHADPLRPSPTLAALVECLRAILGAQARKPTLVLHGDALDLALSSTGHAVMAFERFIELAFPAGGPALFQKDILYLPGNHDHHVWESARETLYAETLAKTTPGQPLPDGVHATRMFAPEAVRVGFLTQILQRFAHLNDAHVLAAYPALGLRTDDNKKCVIVTHGHFVESLYYLTTDLISLMFPGHRRPDTLAGIERENFAWIDFFWGTLGQSGAAGRDVAVLYDKLQDEAATRKLIQTVARSLVNRGAHHSLVEWAETRLLDFLLLHTFGRLTHLGRNDTRDVLDPDARAALARFVEGPIHSQIAQELGALPDDTTFIYGHTHKPFEMEFAFNGFPRPVKVYNSGGWIVDTEQMIPVRGGAVILVDERLDVVSLRLFNEQESPGDQAVAVASLDVGSPLFKQVEAAVDPTADPWRRFSAEVGRALDERGKALAAEIKSEVEDPDEPDSKEPAQ